MKTFSISLRNPILARLVRILWAAAFVAPALQVRAGVVLTTLHSFQFFPNGANPSDALVQGSDGNFYGTTPNGGTNGGRGTVFKISANGILTSLYSFTGGSDGANPSAGLVESSDGNFYGTTPSGGANGDGTLFRISASGTLASLYSFTGGDDGARPEAELLQGSDGSFYGTASSGGQGGAGTVFRLTIVPEFQSVTLTDAGLSLTWSTEAGGKYQLQSNPDLNSGDWTNWGNALIATNSTLKIVDSVTNGAQQFYRLVVSP